MPKNAKSKSKGKSVQLWKRYDNGKLKGRLCPKCKSFLAEMKDRTYCGKCKYVEVKKAA